MSSVAIPVITDVASVDKLSLKELRVWLGWKQISTADCIEKSDLVGKVKAAITEQQQKAAAASTASATSSDASRERAPSTGTGFGGGRERAPSAQFDRPASMGPALRRLKSVSGAGRHRAQAVLDMTERLVNLSSELTSGGSESLIRDMWMLIANYCVHYEHEWSTTDSGMMIGSGEDADDANAGELDADSELTNAGAIHELDVWLQLPHMSGTNISGRGKSSDGWRRAWAANKLNVCHTAWAIHFRPTPEKDAGGTTPSLFIGVSRTPGEPTNPSTSSFYTLKLNSLKLTCVVMVMW